MKTKDDYPMILKANDIQEILQVSKRKAYEVMDQEGFPCIRIGKLKRVYRDSFFEWLDEAGKK